MRTVPEAVADLVRRSPFLEDALVRGLLNVSAVARELRPAVARELVKPVGEAAVMMALSRLGGRLRRKPKPRRLFRGLPAFMLRSGLVEITCASAETLPRRVQAWLGSIRADRNRFFTFTQGTHETTMILSRNLEEGLRRALKGEKITACLRDLSSLSVQLPEGAHLVPGLYSLLLRTLAWEGINVVEVVSTLHEFNLILEDKRIDQAFAAIKNLF